MKRRNALKMVATTVCGLMALPGWATNWTPDSLQKTGTATSFLSASEVDLLAEITDIIIPVTNEGQTSISGARGLNVHQFIEKMVTDCYDKQTQVMFRKGLNSVDDVAQVAIGMPFLEGDIAQRLDILRQMSQSNDPTQKDFVQLVKALTIRGYMNSEYVMTNLTHYEMAPARYKGCVPVKK
ncbi:MAG: gluconate 2-dehydrogenase subunit 3 family protein [Rudanella sp.]|nr:gluconate 2-dehydrogenase subunit 3 family protein [Rudanella sp.]